MERHEQRKGKGKKGHGVCERREEGGCSAHEQKGGGGRHSVHAGEGECSEREEKLGEDLPKQLVIFSAGFPIDFTWEKPAGKVKNGTL